MKKLFAILVIIAIIMSIPVAVFAEEGERFVVEKTDSSKISAEVKQQLGVKASERVIKMYNVSLHGVFNQINSIDELFETKGLILEEYYAVQSSDGTLSYKKIADNSIVELNSRSISQEAITAFQDNTVTAKISPDIEVYESYYLSGEACHTGTAIYYKTNKGDFVYYNYYAIGNSEYLFPIKDFCEYQREICAELQKYPDSFGGADISQLWDLTKYDIHSTAFDLNVNAQQPTVVDGANPSQSDNLKNITWGIAIAGIVLAAAVGVYIGVRAHKRKA